MMRSGSRRGGWMGREGGMEQKKTIQRLCPFAKVAPRSCWQLRAVWGRKEEETSSSYLVLQRWSQQQEMGHESGKAEVLWGRSSSKSKRQRKLLNEIFALKFCQVSCARLPPMRTSWLRSASRSSSRDSGLPQHTHTQSHAHSRTSVLSRSLLTDSNSRAGAGKYH